MLLICIKIFLARIVDVSLGTIRTILTIKKKTLYASSIAFIEVFIWFVIAKEALNIEINSLLIPFSYSLGYASGTFIGGYISNILVNDDIIIQIIINENNSSIINNIRKMGYGISILDLQKGYNDDQKQLLLIQTKRKKLSNLVSFIKKNTNHSFMVINEVQKVK